MKKMMKKLALMLCAILTMNSVFVGAPVYVMAEDLPESATVSFGYDDTSLSFGEIQWKNGDEAWHTQSSAGTENATHLRIKYTNEGKIAQHTALRLEGVDIISENMSALESEDGMALEAGRNYAFEHIEFISNEQQNPGGQVNPPLPEITDPIEISVSVKNYEENFFSEGNPIRIDRYEVREGKVTVNKAETHNIEVQLDFGAGLSKFIVNDVEYEFVSGAFDTYSVTVAEASSYTIELVKGDGHSVSIVWNYDREEAIRKYGNDDAWVENGRVELVSVKRGEDIIFDEENPTDEGISLREDGGDLFLEKGDDIVLRLVPDYGFQLVSVDINGVDRLKAEENVSTFTIENIQGNIHFKGVFQPADNFFYINSEVVRDVDILDGMNAAESGNLSLTLDDNKSYVTDISEVVEGEKVASIDLGLKNIVSKGSPDEYWESDITSFDDDIRIAMNIDFSQLSEDEEFTVVREHNGELEELPVFSDYENGVIDFPTNKFSTYTIVKKIVERINPEDIPDDHYWEYDFETKRYAFVIDASNPCDELNEKNIVIPANYDLVITKDFHTTGKVIVMSMGSLTIAKDCTLSADGGVYIQDWAQLMLGNAKSATGFDNLYKIDEETKYNIEDLNNTVFESVNGMFIDTTERPQDRGMQLNTNGTDPDCVNSVISYKIYIDGDRTKAPIEGTFEREWEPVECDLKTGTIVDFHIATKKGYKILENGVRFPNNKMVISKEEDETKPSSNEAFEYEFDCSYTFTYTPDLYVSMTVDIIPIDVDPLELAEFSWSYDRAALASSSSEGFDVYVSHGTIEVLSAIDKDGKTLLNSKNPEMAPYWTPDDMSEEMSDWQGNRWQGQRAIFKAGTTVVVKLVPERGYQLTKFAISDIEGTTNPVEGDENTNTYTFVLNRPDFYHLGAVFTKVDDKVEFDGASKVSGGNVTFAEDEISNGTMVLNVSDVEPSATEMNKFNEMAMQNSYSIEQVLNLESEQRFYKAVKDATRDQCWVIDKSELNKPATITLDVGELSGDKVAILHNHNGRYEEIPATYENGSITFEASSFSDFAIVTQHEAKYKVDNPVISSLNEELIEGVYWVKKDSEISIRCATNGSSTFYTTDGTNPDVKNVSEVSATQLYTDVFTIDRDTVVKTIAVKDGYSNSQIVEKTYKVIDESDDWGEIVDDDKAGFANADAVPKGLWVRGVQNYDYTGKAITQSDIRVYHGKKLLELNKDYTVKYTNNTKACREGDKTRAAIVITGKGNYSGTITENFLINPLDISQAMVADENIVTAYNKSVQKKTTKVTYDLNGKVVTLGGSDFTYVYPHTDIKVTSGENAYDANAFKAPGTYEIKLVGKGNYTGERIVKETITDLTLMSTVTVKSIPNQNYTGSDIIPGITTETGLVVTKGSTPLTMGVDYRIKEMKNCVDIGTATMVLEGMGKYAGTKTVTFKIVGRNFTQAKFLPAFTQSLSKGFTWSGSAIEPVVADSDDALVATLSFNYRENNVQKTDVLKGVLKSVYESDALTDEQKRSYDYIYEYVGETVKAENNRVKDTTEIGTVKINFTGVNRYTGKATKQYKINGVNLSTLNISLVDGTAGLNKGAAIYTGSEIRPEVSVSTKAKAATSTTPAVDAVKLTENVDYTLKYEKNINVGTATVTVTGINGYTGVVKKTFKINQYDVLANAGSRITVANIGEVRYQKGGAKPVVTVKDGDKVLELNKDYTVAYSNNTKVNDGSNAKTLPTAKITGKGNYKGSVSKTYTIAKSDISEGAGIVSITSTDITYKNAVNTCKPTIKLIDSDGKALVAGTDYKSVITYKYAKDTTVINMVPSGKVKVAIPVDRAEGEEVDPKNDIIPVGAEITAEISTVIPKKVSNYDGTRTVTFRYVAADISKASVQVQPKEYEGKPVTLTKDEMVVKIGSDELKKTDYEIVGYAKNNAKGTAQVTLRGLGNYGGIKTVNFTITAKSMNYTVVYNKNFGDVTGFMKNTVLPASGKVLSNSYKRNGYTFAGWTNTPGKKEVEIKNAGILNPQNVTSYGSRINLYSQWTPVVNKITYSVNGGKVTPAESQKTYTIETGLETLPVPTKAGYKFAGWYTTSNFKPESEVTLIPTGWYGNKTLYAKWVK